MATVTSSGVASGNDFESIITATLASKKQLLTKSITVGKAKTEIEKDGVNSLKSALKTFKSACDALTDTKNVLNTHKITTSQNSDYSAFTIKANSDCANTSFDLTVNQLAKAESISRKFSTKDENADNHISNSFSAGTLTFNLGDDEEGNARTFDVEVSEGDTLEMIRTRINKNTFGVSCNLISTSQGYSLSFNSGKTGEDTTNLSISVNSTDSEGHDSLSMFAFSRDADTVTDENGKRVSNNSSVWNYNQGQDAKITVSGEEISSHTNEFNQIAGVTITANKISESETIDGVTGLKSYNVDIASDADAALEKMQSFVNAYNKLMSSVNTLYARNTYTNGKNNYDGGDLAGDSQLKSLQGALTSMITKNNDTTDSGFNIFSCGLEFNKDGTLSIDSSKFKESYETSLSSMSSLFTDQGGLVKEMSNYVNDYTKFGGILDERLERLNTAITAYEAKENRNEEILSKYEESLRKKYSNLDTLMAGYTTSMGYLSNVLSGMNTSS